MKRLILATVALSFLAVPFANAQPGTQANYIQVQKADQSRDWNKQRQKIVRKQVVKKRVVRKPVIQQRWARGKQVPAWQRRQVVRDYSRHGLRRPGHGQHWIRVGNDYLLVSIVSGIIANLIAGR